MNGQVKVGIGATAFVGLSLLAVYQVAPRAFAEAVAAGNGKATEFWAAVLRINEPLSPQALDALFGGVLFALGLALLAPTIGQA